VRIVVNHVTRMKKSRICVAGIDAATFRHVRPVTPPKTPITRTFLRENGGPFGAGALVDIGAVKERPDPPETEDHTFSIDRAQHVEDLDDTLYFTLLERVGDADILSAFGPDLVEVRRRKFAVPAGCGTRSLAVVPVPGAKLSISDEKLYLLLWSPRAAAKIRVTDVRFYEADQTTIKRGVVADVNRRLASGIPACAMLGLARAIPDDEAGAVHWLMANGLCLADRAVGDVP
jgi:hypothetical protein